MSAATIGVLMVGIASSIQIATRAAATDNSSNAAMIASLASAELASELAAATSFQERNTSSVAFTVADRDANGADERIVYSWNGQAGGQLNRTYNGTSAVAATGVHIFSLQYTTQPATTLRRVLFVHGNVSGLKATYDATRRDLIKSWNYQVVPLMITASTSQADIDAALASVDAAHISATVDPAVVQGKLKNTTAGVLIECHNLYSAFGLSTSNGTIISETATRIEVNGHYITSSWSTGSLTILTASQSMTLLAGTPAAGLQVLARRRSGGTEPTLTVTPAGGILVDGTRCAGPRVTLPWGHDSFDPATLNAAGQFMWREALEWAAHEVAATAVDVTLQTAPSSTSRVQTRIELAGKPQA